ADGTAAMATARLVPPGPRAVAPARVSGPARRRTSGWAIAGLTALAVLAIVALVAGLIVSQQPGKQTVPALVGKTNAEGEALLKDRKLVPDPRGINRTDCAPNAVLTQATAANTRVDEGTRITYEWCAGPGRVTVPAVLNLTLANADQQLKAAELKSKVERV